MKKSIIVVIIGLIAVLSFNVQAQNEMSLKTSSPRVVKTFPESGDMAVDPSIKEIQVTFSEEDTTTPEVAGFRKEHHFHLSVYNYSLNYIHFKYLFFKYKLCKKTV